MPFESAFLIFFAMLEQKIQPTPATPVQYIKGIGPKRASVLKKLGIETVRDLLYYFPRDYIDLTRVENIADVRRFINSNQNVTTIGTVKTFDIVGRPPRQRFVAILADETGTIPLVFFQSVHYFKKAFTAGETLAVSGKVTAFQNRPQIIHPSIDRLMDSDGKEEGFLHTKGIVPKYPSTEDLHNVKLETKGFRRVLRAALDQFIDAVEEFLPNNICKRHNLLALREAIQQIHFPESYTILEEARRRLKFDELFFLQLLLAVRRKIAKLGSPGISFRVESKLARQLVDSLPFRLTKAQIRVIGEVAEDMCSLRPMNRLLQGDVGSGKTIVALTAMLIAVENGYQAAFMAPTEILAEQHYHTLRQFLGSLPVHIRLLVGGLKKTLRKDILEEVRRGSAQIVVGTHALLQEQVEFAKLGLVVIDEQHRFGVVQRLRLRQMGFISHSQTVYPDVLTMTATPIPRTLSLTIYGDLDVSIIDELPLYRKPIKTMVKFESQRRVVYKFLKEEISRGKQVYVVYPLVEESEKMDLRAATEHHYLLQKETFPDLQVGLIHGRMPSEEKETVMSAFKDRKIHILVSTTVIEVGIDIPNATVMVIEHAERFGLSQLHQLRGRVGRGADQSYCVLIAPDWMARFRHADSVTGVDDELRDRQKADIRLRTMLQTSDGFKIAEVDLDLRGPGDFFGTRQSGLPELHIAHLLSDNAILTAARREAFQVIEKDPQLRLTEHASLREHFATNYSEHLKLLEAG